tara:strand:+ start:5650 stop:8085 length:2436 start_codon:yes stop_codon:yes gene_type:complete
MNARAKLDLKLILSEVNDQHDACLERLQDLLQAKRGIERSHIIETGTRRAGELCVHFDQDLLSLQDVRQFARRAGLELQVSYGHLQTDIEPLPQRRAKQLARSLQNEEGILEAAVSGDGAVRVEFDRGQIDDDGVRSRIRRLSGVVEHSDDETHAHGGIFGERTELIFVALCGVTLLLGWLLPKLAPIPEWIPLSVLIGAYFFGGWFTVKEAWANIRSGRFEIDSLMLVAAAGAAVLGAWAEGALLLFLFSLGHALEAYAMGRAKRAIEALGELAPRSAAVRRDGTVQEIDVENLRIGDVVLVKPNARLPADGFVSLGESSVNQAPITGESVPVDKSPVPDEEMAATNPDQLEAAHRVFAGSINGEGALEIYVTRVAADSTLARVVEMVRNAETQQSPTQQFTDRFERIFVPVVIVGAVLAMFAWVVIDETFSESFYRAMALLVAASPCALAIATPSAVLSGVARAARGGVLVKGGAPLEHLGRLSAIAFDKTGTLTEGKPELTDVVPYGSTDEQHLLRVAIGIEMLSDHPLAAAVVRDGIARLGSVEPFSASDLKSITGRGVTAEIEGETTYIGKDDLFAEVDGPPLPDGLREEVENLESAGRTTMIVRHGDTYLGVIGLMDTPREAATAVIKRLRSLGIRRMLMISGDNQQVADAVAREVGLDEARGDLMPDDKVATIKQLRSEGQVAMVGDGVNDAPAMANATVGIAMGAAGSDVALETADVALMADDLNHLPFAVGLSRATSRVIRQNLWLSLGIVALLVPSTLFGLSIGAAVLVHEGSTVIVVFNALRLLAFPGVVDTINRNDIAT